LFEVHHFYLSRHREKTEKTDKEIKRAKIKSGNRQETGNKELITD